MYILLMFFSVCLMCFFVIYVLFSMLIYLLSLLTVYSLLNAGLLIMGKSSGAGFLSKLKGGLSRSGRPRHPPTRLLEDDTSQGGRGVGGRAPRGGGGGGRAPTGGRGGSRCGPAKKLRSVSDIGGSSSTPSYTEAPSESEEEEEVEEFVQEEEEEGEEEGCGGEGGGEGEGSGEEGSGGEGGGEVWGDLPPGDPKGWLRGVAELPTPPATEESKCLIEPAGTEYVPLNHSLNTY